MKNLKPYNESWGDVVDYKNVDDPLIRVYLEILSFGGGEKTAHCEPSHFFRCLEGIFRHDQILQYMDKQCDDGLLIKNKSTNRYGCTYSIPGDDTSEAWKQIISYDGRYITIMPEKIAKKLGYNKILDANNKLGILEMKNLKDFKKFNENYPPGAANDPRAPWNEPASPDYDTADVEGFLYDEDENEVPVKINYTYYEAGGKHIVDYSFEIADDSTLNKDYIDEGVRELIRQDCGRCDFD